MNTHKVFFTNQNQERLSARLELPMNQEPHTFAIFAHCFTCNKNLTAVRNISRGLTTNGIAVLRFDFTGLGESEGDFADTNFSSNVEDLLAAADFLSKEYQAASLIIGHSLGGAAVIFAASRISSIRAVVTIGAPSDPEHVGHLIESGREEINASGKAQVTIGGRPFTIKKQFLEDLMDRDMEKRLKELRKPILIMHSPQDQTVGIDNAANLYQYAHHPKSFVTLDGADHLLSNKEDSYYAGQMIGSWVKRYIEIPEQDIPVGDKKVIVRTGKGYTTEIGVGKHYLVADEPAEVGGNNYGPTPYDLLSASLGACTSMTLRMYANRKNWPLDEVKVHLEHSKDYAKDCEECESSGSKIDHFDRMIELKGNLDEMQKKRLMEIADKCPVHRTLHSEVAVRTVLKE